MKQIKHFAPDRAAYIRSHIGMAAVFSALGMGVLAAMGNPHLWTAAAGACFAIGVRGWFLWSEVRDEVWTLTPRQLDGPQGRMVPLREIARLNTIFSTVQIVTTGGDKHLIKYQPDRDATVAAIDLARKRA